MSGWRRQRRADPGREPGGGGRGARRGPGEQGEAVEGREEGEEDHVQAGAEAGHRGVARDDQEGEEHPLRDQQARRLQEPCQRHLHRVR